eukprot:Nk52_evm1s1614 gene=Nk52_evmTU1s1614
MDSFGSSKKHEQDIYADAYKEMSIEESLELVASRTNPHSKWHMRIVIICVCLLGVICGILIAVAVLGHFSLKDMEDKTDQLVNIVTALNYTLASNFSQMVNGTNSINQNIYYICSTLTILDKKAVSALQWILGKLPKNLTTLLDAILKAALLDPTIIPDIYVPTNNETNLPYNNFCCPPGGDCENIYQQVLAHNNDGFNTNINPAGV